MTGVVYVVTCAQCGQSWQRRNVGDGQKLDCIFCGLAGRLSVGAPPQGEIRRAKARLER